MVVPERVEFWQGADFRLHDRFAFSKNRLALGVVSTRALKQTCRQPGGHDIARPPIM